MEHQQIKKDKILYEKHQRVSRLGDYNWFCEFCGISKNTARRWVMERRVPYIKLANGSLVRFDKDVIESWLSNSQMRGR